MRYPIFKLFQILVLLSINLVACSAQPTLITQVDDGTSTYWPTDGWRSSAPEEQGMNSQLLTQMLDELIMQGHNIDSISVVRNGYMVLDVVVYPYKSSNKHIIHSCTKSIVSALIGIALEQGYLESVDQPLLEIFSNRDIANVDTRKQSITVEDLLTMSSGLMCRDSYIHFWRGLNEMRASDDWVQYMLDLPMAESPGTRFEYCNGGSFLLSAIIHETTGVPALAYAKENLFEPLGILDVYWPSNPQGISIGWGEMRMLPHDMAKLGYLYLNEGVWDGEQIVPEEWVSESTKKRIDATLQGSYGYQWWIGSSDAYMALGYAGQYIYMAPELNLVVVFTSDLPDTQFYVPQQLIEDFILPAVESLEPVSPNPIAFEDMNSKIDVLQSP